MQGVGGVEGAGHPVYMTTIYAREIFAAGSAGFAIRLTKFLFLTSTSKKILTKVVYLFNRIANSYTQSSRIANPAEPRRVLGNSMGVSEITP